MNAELASSLVDSVTHEIKTSPVLVSSELSVERLTEIENILYQKYTAALRKKDLGAAYAAGVFSLACGAVSKLLTELNIGEIQTAAPWTHTGFLSLPTFVADIKTATESFPALEWPLQSLLLSFFKWQQCMEAEVECCCGGFSSMRMVKSGVMLRTKLEESPEKDSNEIILRQYIGVKTDNAAHRAMHYSFSCVEAEAEEDTVVIFSSHMYFQIKARESGNLCVTPIRRFLHTKESFRCANEFNFAGFFELFSESFESYRRKAT